jgi:hypothetical protein
MLWRGQCCATHGVVIALEIEIGSGGKVVGCGSIYHLGKPSEYYPILFYKLRHLQRFEVFSHYYLPSDFLALLFSNERFGEQLTPIILS